MLEKSEIMEYIEIAKGPEEFFCLLAVALTFLMVRAQFTTCDNQTILLHELPVQSQHIAQHILHIGHCTDTQIQVSLRTI